MALETSSYIVGLVVSNPDGGDARSTADDHIRLLKSVLKRTFPLMDGAVSLSHTQLMLLGDLSASVQLQLNQLRDGSATANNAVNSRFANSASHATTAAQLNGVAASDYARKSQENTLSDDVMLSSTSISLRWRASGAATNQKIWRATISTNGTLSIDTEEDSGAFGENAIVLTRTGTNVDAIDFSTDALRWGGSTILRASSGLNATNLTSGTIPDARVSFSSVSQHQASLSGVASARLANSASYAAIAGNADTVDGYHAGEAAANTVAVRNSSGHIFAVNFAGSSAQLNGAITNVITTQGDDFFHKTSLSNLGSQLSSQNISGRTGTTKTLSTSMPSGGNNGDMWYRY